MSKVPQNVCTYPQYRIPLCLSKQLEGVKELYLRVIATLSQEGCIGLEPVRQLVLFPRLSELIVANQSR